MRDYIASRVVDAAHYIIKNKATVRSAAQKFGVSKSTIHKDVAERLPEIDKRLAKQAREILNLNLDERHLRGGESTKMKYQKNCLTVQKAFQRKKSTVPTQRERI